MKESEVYHVLASQQECSTVLRAIPTGFWPTQKAHFKKSSEGPSPRKANALLGQSPRAAPGVLLDKPRISLLPESRHLLSSPLQWNPPVCTMKHERDRLTQAPSYTLSRLLVRNLRTEGTIYRKRFLIFCPSQKTF